MIHFKKNYIGVEMERHDIWELAIMLSELMVTRANNYQFPVTNVRAALDKLFAKSHPCYRYIGEMYSFLDRNDKIDELNQKLEKIMEDKLIDESLTELHQSTE